MEEPILLGHVCARGAELTSYEGPISRSNRSQLAHSVAPTCLRFADRLARTEVIRPVSVTAPR